VESRLAEHLLELGGSVDVFFERGRAAPVSQRLEDELDNIRAVMRWALELPDVPVALRLTSALGWFWAASQRHTEGLGYAADGLERAASHPANTRVRTLHWATVFASVVEDTARTRRFGEEALVLYREERDDRRAAEICVG
jgi:predicted ATPase